MVKSKENLAGNKYGRLTVIEQTDDYVYPNGKRRAQWLCMCECGNIIKVEQSNLKRGNSNSCGCYNDELRILRSTTHGDRRTRLYGIWTNIKSRCYNPNSTSYSNYGARGILMCDEWKDSYYNFKSWANESGYIDSNDVTIERVDVNGGYSPENCIWASPKEQANNRRNTVFFTHNNETHSLSEWADITGIKYHTLFARIYKLNWDFEKAINTNTQYC